MLTDAAEAELRSIIRYTRNQWGDQQARAYLKELTHGFERVASTTSRAKDLSALYPELRMSRCGHHYLFCLPQDHAPSLIVAIFHERMDLMARLADRIG